MIGLATLLAPAVSHATNPGTSTILQPVNLGKNSDPSRIPLGAVGVYSNYGYGTHRVIGEGRAIPDGPMRWEEGSELDQNLASVFGISIEPEDSSIIAGPPVFVRLKAWKPPGYSPYSREQVLAATLWCLLRSAGGTPERPVDVRVVAEAEADKPLEAKFSAKYVTVPGEDRQPVPPIQVPGTRMEIDARGIPWVVFQDAESKPAAAPGFVVFKHEGADEPAFAYYLLPVWGNGGPASNPLVLGHYAAPMHYTCYQSTGTRDANQLLAEGGAHEITVSTQDSGSTVTFHHPGCTPETLAANILALVLSAQPTEEKPLEVRLYLEQNGLVRYPAFRSAPGWTEDLTDSKNRYASLSAKFVWDPVGKKLAKGSVPLVKFGKELDTIEILSKPDMDDVATDLVKSGILARIEKGIQEGTLTPEKQMGENQLAESGIRRKIGEAGFHAGLASVTADEDQTEAEPPATGDADLDQYFRLGWNAGRSIGQRISQAVREEVEEKDAPKKKASESPALKSKP